MDIEESRNNLKHYNLYELQIEAKRFDIDNIESMTKEELIEEILKVSLTIENIDNY